MPKIEIPECDVCNRMHTDKQYCPKRMAKYLILATYGINKLEIPSLEDAYAIKYFHARYNLQPHHRAVRGLWD